MKKLLRYALMLPVILLGANLEANVLFAQSTSITGKVTDSQTGEALPGVNVVVSNTTTGTATNADGQYTLSVSNAQDTLVFSYIGYITQKVPVNGRTSIDVALVQQAVQGQELVVVGYGTEKKRDLTGSVSTVSGDDIAKVPVANVAQSLAGKLPGVNVTTQDGRPGASVSIRVRGGGSVTQSNQPLLVIDGFPGGSLSDIPAEDIQSISVLKDAAATAIYGARGSHGVIIVTTKNPRKGRLTVTYNGYAKLNTAPKYFHTMGAYDYIAYNWAYAKAINDNYADAWEQLWGIGRYAAADHNSEGVNHYKGVPAANFEKQVYGNSWSQNHNLNISYGNDNTKYRLSLDYLGDNGMKVNSYYKRAFADFNLDQKILPTLTFNMDTRFAATNQVDNESTVNGVGSILSSAYWFRPVATKDVLGELNSSVNTQLGPYDNILQDEFNPVARIKDYTPLEKDRSIRLNTSLNWDVIKGLAVKSAFSLHGSFNRTSTWSGATYNDYLDTQGNKTYSGDAEIEDFRGWNLVWTNTLHYNVQGLGSHNILNVLVGQEITNSGSRSTDEFGKKYPASFSSSRAFANMDQYLHDPDIQNFGFSSKDDTPDRLLSFFGRANYSLLDRYLFTATFRADGSSRFAPSHRWAYFPAGAIAWRLSEEKFLRNVSWLSNLKLRVSYGETGDDGISASLWEQNWKSGGLTNWSISEVQQPYYEPASSTIANPNLKWETTVMGDIGLDFGFFSNRLHGSIDYYKNTTKNLLMQTQISAISGFSSTYANVGKTENRGIEVGLGADLIQSRDFNLSASVYVSVYSGKIVSLAEGVNGLYHSYWGSSVTQPNTGDYNLVVGQPVGIVRGWVYEGWYTVDDFNYKNGVYTLKPGVPDIAAGITGTVYGTGPHKPAGQTAYPGVMKFKDINHDGVVDENDVTNIGNMNPKSTGGFTFEGNYKNIDFKLHFSYSYGNQVYDVNYLAATYGSKEDGLFRNRLSMLSSAYKIYDIQNGQLTSVTDPAKLKALNKNATMFLPYQENPIASSYGIKDGSFLRLNTFVVGYTLPGKWIHQTGLNRVRLYGTIYNAFVLTNYPGLDPEVSTNLHQNKSIYPTPGLDFGAYPRARSFVLGINVGF